ncbi:hypothetical protein CTAYLR_000244 [Chrysophaeum taylorii]|uniref:Nucleotide-diphospho-sugar transferase domain-containing protein n=1 Tax=Chrysophaeum taylorii TaxID=2483200 RepID=A0AAD7XJ39_9STRA|nr:hypothetical protein CTAYLR_000244 [Chrysophaeum taylorii]
MDRRRRWRLLEVWARRRGLVVVVVTALVGILVLVSRGHEVPRRPEPLTQEEAASGRTARVGLVTTASRRQRVGASEYGELKATYVYAASIDNKARYCASRGWELVVGAEVEEAEGRSARWNKVAWLRRVVDTYDWIVWMDLDCFFSRNRGDVLRALNPQYDAHFTPDVGGEKPRVNTGFFALRGKSAWTKEFLERVWDHNDSGEGASDQNSINHFLDSLGAAERAKHVKLYDKSLLNAFPEVKFVPTEGFEMPPPGDETSRSLVVHFAGQYGGARSSDGETPGSMLVQFLDMMLKRHAAFLEESALSPAQEARMGLRPAKEATDFVTAARASLESCLSKIGGYEKETFNNDLGVRYFEPSTPQAACDVGDSLRNLRHFLGRLLLDSNARPKSLACSRDDADGRDPQQLAVVPLLRAMTRVREQQGRKRLVHSTRYTFSTDPLREGFAVVAHECAYATLERGDLTVADGDSVMSLPMWRNKTRPPPTMASTVEEFSTLAVLAPLPVSRRSLYPPTEGESKQLVDDVVEASYFWRFLAPLALACAQNAPRDAQFVIQSHPGDRDADFDADWRHLAPFRDRLPLAVDAKEHRTFYADTLYTCHAGDSALSISGIRRVATQELGRLRAALRPPPPMMFGGGGNVAAFVVVVCGQPPFGFLDCEKIVSTIKPPLGVHLATSQKFTGKGPAWYGLRDRVFYPDNTVLVVAPRAPDKLGVAPLLCAACSPGAVFLELTSAPKRRGQEALGSGYASFAEAAAEALGLRHDILYSYNTARLNAKLAELLPAEPKPSDDAVSVVKEGEDDDGPISEFRNSVTLIGDLEPSPPSRL